MNYFVAIPHKNSPELLRKAIDSVPKWRDDLKIVVLDVSDYGQELNPDDWHRIEIKRLCPLSFTQGMNYFNWLALRRERDLWFHMHNDCEASPGFEEKFEDYAAKLLASGQKWGAVINQGEMTICAFNPHAIKAAGWWDEWIPNYYCDPDMNRRLGLLGYTFFDAGLPCTHYDHGAKKADPKRRFVMDTIITSQGAAYYTAKWGGMPGKEKFTRPFNNPLFPDYDHK